MDNVMKFAMSALTHTSGDVRQKAQELIVSLYAVAGTSVRDHLPTDSPAVRRNVLYKLLFEAFDRIDQRPGGPADTRVSTYCYS